MDDEIKQALKELIKAIEDNNENGYVKIQYINEEIETAKDLIK